MIKYFGRKCDINKRDYMNVQSTEELSLRCVNIYMY